MSTDEGWSFAPPAFKADEALVKLRRALRDLKLAERGPAFELRGKRVVELAADATGLQVKLARRLALTPEFDRLTVASSADLNKLTTEIARRLARWEQDE